MERGILLAKDKNLTTIQDWAKAGLKKFRTDERTRGFAPYQIQVNPIDNGFPAGFTVEGLPVVCNEEVRAGFLRVVTYNLGGDI